MSTDTITAATKDWIWISQLGLNILEDSWRQRAALYFSCGWKLKFVLACRQWQRQYHARSAGKNGHFSIRQNPPRLCWLPALMGRFNRLIVQKRQAVYLPTTEGVAGERYFASACQVFILKGLIELSATLTTAARQTRCLWLTHVISTSPGMLLHKTLAKVKLAANVAHQSNEKLIALDQEFCR